MSTRLRYGILALGVLLGVFVMPSLQAQTLSNQVLALLSRTNSWIGQNTFYNIRIPIAAVPGDTSTRIYTDISGNLYYNGILIAGVGGVTNPHNLLSTTHPDTLAASPTRAAVLIGNATPAWARYQPSSSGCVFQYNGTDSLCSVTLTSSITVPSSTLTGALPAIAGASLTTLNASSLSTGTVPLARLSGITNAEISGAAAIAYSKLDLAGAVNLVTDTVGILPQVFGGTDVAASADNDTLVSNGAAWVATSLPDCPTDALSYDDATNLFACTPIPAGGSGTVTSVALTLPSFLSVAGSPITTSGTLAVSLASQLQNLVLASPNGAPGTPAFRAFLNADLPTSGVAAATYPKVTVNAQGIITAGATQITASTDVTGVLARANGGTSVAVSGDDTVLVGNTTTWVATALPDCTRLVNYATSTNLFACATAFAAGTITTSTPLSITASWNNGAVTFNQFLVNVTDSASATASTLVDFQVGSASRFAVRKDGSLYLLTRRAISTSTPTISAGFGTAPAIAGIDSAIRLTQGTPVGATGTITFGTAFNTAPVCVGQDETTTAGNPLKLTATTTTVAVASGGTMVDGDLLTIVCIGY